MTMGTLFDKLLRRRGSHPYCAALVPAAGRSRRMGGTDKLTALLGGEPVLHRTLWALDNAGVRWQICELGKVDEGGGGTVAQYMANRNIATLDAGVPVLSMHAPFEVVAKLDCYEMYRACKALYQAH